jgi:hypothetical protein
MINRENVETGIFASLFAIGLPALVIGAYAIFA